MLECDKLQICPFYNDTLPRMPDMSGVYKRRFCKGEYIDCARYRVSIAKGKEAVPTDLLPNQYDRIQELSL